jgi:hypothetical protein
MIKLGYPILPVIERAELSLFDGRSRSEGASHVATALVALIVVCLAFPICFLGFTALTARIPEVKHSTLASVSSPRSILPGVVAGLRDHGATSSLDKNQSDPATLSTNSPALAEADAQAIAPNATSQSTPQLDETDSAVHKKSDGLRQSAEDRRARPGRTHQSQPIATGARKLGKEKHKNGIAHKHREMNLAGDGTTIGQ